MAVAVLVWQRGIGEKGGTFLFFGCWLGQNSVGLGLGGWKSDFIGRFFVFFFAYRAKCRTFEAVFERI